MGGCGRFSAIGAEPWAQVASPPRPVQRTSRRHVTGAGTGSSLGSKGAHFGRNEPMEPRLDPFKACPEVMQAMLQLEERVRGAGLEPSLIHLVKLRASQINGCAFCLHMHATHAREAGASDERLYLVGAFRESPLFTPRERAALVWTESLTLLAQTGAPD